MHHTVYRDLAGFSALRDEWNSLLHSARFDTIFLTWEWQSTWWEHLGGDDLWLLAWRDEAGSLVGIAPFYRETTESGERRMTLVGCLEVSDYLDMIVRAEREGDVYAALLDWLQGSEAPEWDVLDLCNLPESSLIHSLLPRMAEERGHVTKVFQEDVCPIIDLPNSWEAYLGALDKKQRHEIRRKVRRAEGLTRTDWYVVNRTDDVADQVDEFIELHQLSQPEKDAFMDPQMQGFFRSAARITLDAGWLRLSFLEMDGEKAATMLCFDYDNDILVYNSGYDPQRFGSLSPGIVLLAYEIEEAIKLGRKRFDFLRGDEVYKYRFGALDTSIWRVLISRGPERPG